MVLLSTPRQAMVEAHECLFDERGELFSFVVRVPRVALAYGALADDPAAVRQLVSAAMAPFAWAAPGSCAVSGGGGGGGGLLVVRVSGAFAPAVERHEDDVVRYYMHATRAVERALQPRPPAAA